MDISFYLNIDRNFYSTVSLPQNIVSTIDVVIVAKINGQQTQEPLSSVYVHGSDHMLDKNGVQIQQPYPSNVCVGSIMAIGPNVSHTVEPGISMPDVTPLPLNTMEKTITLKGTKLSFTNRSFESLTYSEIPLLMKELSELRRIQYHSDVRSMFVCYFQKNGLLDDPLPQEDISNLTLSQVPALLEEYKSLVVSMKKSFVCPTCNKTFSSRYSLNVHMNIHSESKPYECPHTNCRKCFRTKSALNTHINLTHTEIKDNICTICGKAFAKAWLLRQHMTRHSANHRYVCLKCSKSFAYPYLVLVKSFSHVQLKEHEITKHEGIKPYVCSFEGCGKQFNSKNTLHLHELAHSRPFMCSVCLKQFSYACDLKRHQKKAHPRTISK